MKKVFSMVALMVFMNTAMVMAASDSVSNNRQDTTLRNDKTQVELMSDRHVDSDYIDPTKAGIRV
jgi:PBP1b-binding outer membrane lipoprotein LpoB